MLHSDLVSNIPECSSLKESQMAYLLNHQTPKALQARQKILLFTLQKLEETKVTDLKQGKIILDKYITENRFGSIDSVLDEKANFINTLERLLEVVSINLSNSKKQTYLQMILEARVVKIASRLVEKSRYWQQSNHQGVQLRNL